MSRQPRSSAADVVYHALNRGNCRMKIFTKPGDYAAFLQLLEQGRQRTAMRILGFCLMPNHWHLVLWPRRDGDLSRFLGWVCTTHVRRWREHRGNTGEGHLYQGRFKSFPVQDDPHLLTLLRYVEANPLRARLVERAEQWQWSSLGIPDSEATPTLQLSNCPVDRPPDWARTVNALIEDSQLAQLRLSVTRGQPFGSGAWLQRIVKRLGLESTLRDPWRPHKQTPARAG